MAKKTPPTDGLGPKEISKIRGALRLVWHRSLARKLCVKRCTDEKGFTWCEQCGEMTAQLRVDHIWACGDVDGGYIKRLFCPSTKLMGMCKTCHAHKTKLERARSKATHK